MYSFNFATFEWKRESSKPYAKALAGSSFIADRNWLAIVGGVNAQGVPNNEVVFLDLGQLEFIKPTRVYAEAVTDVPKPLIDPTVVVYHEKILVFGGKEVD